MPFVILRCTIIVGSCLSWRKYLRLNISENYLYICSTINSHYFFWRSCRQLCNRLEILRYLYYYYIKKVFCCLSGFHIIICIRKNKEKKKRNNSIISCNLIFAILIGSRFRIKENTKQNYYRGFGTGCWQGFGVMRISIYRFWLNLMYIFSYLYFTFKTFALYFNWLLVYYIWFIHLKTTFSQNEKWLKC